jgi:hypothetical protein
MSGIRLYGMDPSDGISPADGLSPWTVWALRAVNKFFERNRLVDIRHFRTQVHKAQVTSKELEEFKEL